VAKKQNNSLMIKILLQIIYSKSIIYKGAIKNILHESTNNQNDTPTFAAQIKKVWWDSISN